MKQDEQVVQVDINTVIQKLSLQIADLTSAKVVLEAENEALRGLLKQSREEEKEQI